MGFCSAAWFVWDGLGWAGRMYDFGGWSVGSVYDFSLAESALEAGAR